MKSIIAFVTIITMIFVSGCGGCTRSYHRTGDLDYYYEEGYRLSDFETAMNIVYSVEFVKKFEALDFVFHYYLAPSNFMDPLGEYDLCVVSISYSAENYELAKQDLFDNTEYVSNMPQYVHNGYKFYRIPYFETTKRKIWLMLNAFNDEKHTIILMGIHVSGGDDINLNVPEEEWPEFLRTYYGEYYDFDA